MNKMARLMLSHCSKQVNYIQGMKASDKRKYSMYYDGAIEAFENMQRFIILHKDDPMGE